MKSRYKKGVKKGGGLNAVRSGRGVVAIDEAELASVEGEEGSACDVEDNIVRDNKIERVDMITSNDCNHAEAIAEGMYNAYAEGKDCHKHQPMAKYADLPDDDKAGWLNVTEQALPIIGKHALGDVRDYLTGQASASKGWKKWMYWGGGIVLAGILAGGAVTMSGCGHRVEMTPERAEVCKDGACLVVEPGRLSFSQAQPMTDVPPVVQGEGK